MARALLIAVALWVAISLVIAHQIEISPQVAAVFSPLGGKTFGGTR